MRIYLRGRGTIAEYTVCEYEKEELCENDQCRWCGRRNRMWGLFKFHIPYIEGSDRIAWKFCSKYCYHQVLKHNGGRSRYVNE
jgi:hypothetical protein